MRKLIFILATINISAHAQKIFLISTNKIQGALYEKGVDSALSIFSPQIPIWQLDSSLSKELVKECHVLSRSRRQYLNSNEKNVQEQSKSSESFREIRLKTNYNEINKIDFLKENLIQELCEGSGKFNKDCELEIIYRENSAIIHVESYCGPRCGWELTYKIELKSQNIIYATFISGGVY